MHILTHPTSRRQAPGLSRPRLLLLLFAGIAALLALAACGKVDDATEISSDGSGVQTLTVTIGENDMDKIDGGADTVEAVIESSNPGLSYEGATKDGTDTVFTMTLEFEDAQDYAEKAQPALEAGELTKTAEVTFTPPSPPFSSGYTFTRNFTSKDLTRWAVKALVDDGKIADASDSDIDSALDQGDVTVTVEDDELERSFTTDDSATAWTNAETVGFDSIEVVTAGVEDPAADSYTRTVTYELVRATYLDATEEFDEFFAEATPEGGELTPAGETGTTWTIAFPAGSADEVSAWTDTALATTDSAFSVETAANAEDPFAIETRVVDSIECTVACGETGTLSQALEAPAGFSSGSADTSEQEEGAGTEEIPLQGGPEPEIITQHIGFRSAAYDVTVDRDGGGSVTMELSLPAADDEIVTEENVIAFLGEGTERSEDDETVIYTLTAEADDTADFSGALQRLGFEGVDGPPQVDVAEQGDGTYAVTLQMGVNGTLHEKLGTEALWTISGDGLRPTAVLADDLGDAALGEDTITVEGTHGVSLTFSAERTGLGAGMIVGLIALLAFLGLLVAAGLVAFLHRDKIRSLLGGDATQTASSPPGPDTAPPSGPAGS